MLPLYDVGLASLYDVCWGQAGSARGAGSAEGLLPRGGGGGLRGTRGVIHDCKKCGCQFLGIGCLGKLTKEKADRENKDTNIFIKGT